MPALERSIGSGKFWDESFVAKVLKWDAARIKWLASQSMRVLAQGRRYKSEQKEVKVKSNASGSESTSRNPWTIESIDDRDTQLCKNIQKIHLLIRRVYYISIAIWNFLCRYSLIGEYLRNIFFTQLIAPPILHNSFRLLTRRALTCALSGERCRRFKNKLSILLARFGAACTLTKRASCCIRLGDTASDSNANN